jgi:hypothetical protein
MANFDIDCIDGTGTDGLARELDRKFPAALRVNSVGQLVRSVESRLGGNQNRIRRLRVFAHGSPGSQGLGRSRDPGPPYRSIRSAGGSLQFATELGRLRSRFASGGWAELHGCSVGAGSAGRSLVVSLASLWGVNVAAGTVVQQPGNPGFETHYVVASPNGSVRERRGVAPSQPLSPGEETGLMILATLINPAMGLGAMLGFTYARIRDS